MSVDISEPVKVLTLTEAAASLRVSKGTVLAMIRKGLPARKVGRAWRIPVTTLNEWLERGQNAVPAGEPEQEPAG